MTELVGGEGGVVSPAELEISLFTSGTAAMESNRVGEER